MFEFLKSKLVLDFNIDKMQAFIVGFVGGIAGTLMYLTSRSNYWLFY